MLRIESTPAAQAQVESRKQVRPKVWGCLHRELVRVRRSTCLSFARGAEGRRRRARSRQRDVVRGGSRRAVLAAVLPVLGRALQVSAALCPCARIDAICVPISRPDPRCLSERAWT